MRMSYIDECTLPERGSEFDGGLQSDRDWRDVEANETILHSIRAARRSCTCISRNSFKIPTFVYIEEAAKGRSPTIII